jgi:Flp pilus assembly protein TadD
MRLRGVDLFRAVHLGSVMSRIGNSSNLRRRLYLAVFVLASVSWANAQDTDVPTTTAPKSVPTAVPAVDLSEPRALLAGNDYAGADRRLREILTQSPDSAEAHFLLGFTLLHEEQPKQSLAEYALGAKHRDPGPAELIGMASDDLVLKDYSDADHLLTTATQRAPKLAIGWYLLGQVQYNEGHAGDAEKSFLACLLLNPHHLRAEYSLGVAYEKLNRPEEATTAYRTAISWQDTLPVKDPQPYLNLGMMLRRQGHVTEAVPYLKSAAAAGPHDPLAHQELGLAYEQLGRYDDALAELNQANSLNPNTETLHFFLGRVYRKAGRGNEATKEFAQAAKLSGVIASSLAPNTGDHH